MRWFCVSATYNLPSWIQTPCGPRMDFAVGGTEVNVDLKSGCPTTTSAGALLEEGMVFQINTRLLFVSATARTVPSVATAVGSCRPLCEAAGSMVVKSGCPNTKLALPPQTGQRAPWPGGSCSGAGNLLLMR